MVLPTGQIDMRQVKQEIRTNMSPAFSASLSGGLIGDEIRALAGPTFASPTSTISLNDLRGKALHIEATGGTIVNSGNVRYHYFTSPGTFTINTLSSLPVNNTATIYMVGGGAGGGFGGAGPGVIGESNVGGGGGGAEITEATRPVTATGSFPVTIAGGGAGATVVTVRGGDGGVTLSPFATPTVGSTDTEGGGGGGTSNRDIPLTQGLPGRGSGGGGAALPPPFAAVGGPGLFGFPGSAGNFVATNNKQGGGGGGHSGGAPTPAGGARPGGAGTTRTWNADIRASGGGGGGTSLPLRGSGGGPAPVGAGGYPSLSPATSIGAAGSGNSGSGGGGGGGGSGGNGGSGIVVIYYPYPPIPA